MIDDRFYVYEHWRPDLDLCFWVGKGTGDRARRFKRNARYDQVVRTLSDLGMCVEVRMVASGLTEWGALMMERERIAFWRSAVVELTNRTDGGEGNRGMFVSAETREKIRRANIGKKHSPETRAKMSKSRTGRIGGRPAGFNHSSETIEKIRAANRGQSRPPELREKLRQANIGKKHSAETKAKMSASRMGNTNGAGGKGLRRSAETLLRMSAAQKGKIVSPETRAKISATLKKRNEMATDG